MVLTGFLGSTDKTSSNGPDRFVGNNNIGHFFLGDARKIFGKLLCADLVLDVEVVFGLGLTNAQNGLHARRQNLLDLSVDGLVVVIEQSSAFRVSTKNVLASDGQNHGSGNTSGEGTLLFEVDGLSTDGDSGVLDSFPDLGDEGVGREDNNLGTERVLLVNGAGFISQKLGEARSEGDGIVFGGGVHLPVSGHDGLTAGIEGSGGGGIFTNDRSERGSRCNKGGKGGGFELHDGIEVVVYDENKNYNSTDKG